MYFYNFKIFCRFRGSTLEPPLYQLYIVYSISFPPSSRAKIQRFSQKAFTFLTFSIIFQSFINFSASFEKLPNILLLCPIHSNILLVPLKNSPQTFGGPRNRKILNKLL